MNDDEMDKVDARAARLAHLAEDAPPFLDTASGIWCMAHAVYDCAEPFCWRCGNHQMDERQRCADPRCRATNTEATHDLIRRMKSLWGDEEPFPDEAICYAIGKAAYEGMISDGRRSVGPEDDRAPAPPPSPEVKR
ncbi:MAG: hypothetical protein HY323_08175 [Betaproteobacteria bacterium]|nr:hypothetical protein [Betaproteobacteria bacterium]